MPVMPWEEDDAWEASGGREFAAGSSGAEQEGPNKFAQGAEAGDELVDFLMSLHLGGKLSAKSVCTIAWWASRAGALGKVKDFAHAPDDSSTGHYMRCIDKAVGVKLSDLTTSMFHWPVPGLGKYDLNTSKHKMPLQLPHQAIEQEIVDRPEIYEQARERQVKGQWPEAFYQHPVVRNTPDQVILPVAIYLDGISLTRNDSLLGIFVYCLVTMRRHLVAVLRKSFLCRCGCGGRCTMWPIFAIMSWSFRALAAGRRPATKPDGQAWSADDGARHSQAGADMRVRACVLYLKADWAEFSKTLGLASWSSQLFPCPFCRKTQGELHTIAGLNVTDTTWQLISHEDLERATRACEIDVVLRSAAQHREVLAALQYNRDKNGPRGRALIRDLPSLGLRAGDRLEQSSSLWILADFDEANEFPMQARFLRRSAETRTTFRNPLWDETIGLSHDVLAIDILHTLSLGPALSLVGAVFWFVIDSDIWGLA